MRIGECTGLTWKDVDFKKRSISVNHSATYYTRNGIASFGISAPKTEAGVRHIPMMGAVYDALKNEYEEIKENLGITINDRDTGFL